MTKPFPATPPNHPLAMDRIRTMAVQELSERAI